MSKPTMNYDIASRAGQDAANQRMEKAGRTKWNRADYNLACRVMNRLLGYVGRITAR